MVILVFNLFMLFNKKIAELRDYGVNRPGPLGTG
jgi:hypothetical protein